MSVWAHAALAAPVLIGLTVGNSTDTLVSINPTTGALTTIGGNLPDGFTNNAYALNQAGSQYYYEAGTSLIVVNTTSGALLGDYSLSTSLHGMAYDAATGTLLGLTVGNSSDALVSINPATGALTTIGSGTLPVGLSNSAYALNPVTGQFYYLTSGKLNAVNVATGALTGSYSFAGNAPSLGTLTYDSATGGLLALAYGNQGEELTSVSATGQITAIGSGHLPSLVTNNVNAFNAATGQVYYEDQYQLITVNAATGAQVSQAPLTSYLDGIVSPGAAAVPEPAGVEVLLSGLGALGLVRVGSRRRPGLCWTARV